MRFVIGIVLKVKANIKHWGETKEVKEALKLVRNEFDDYVRLNTGLQPRLQLPGNYVREMLSDKNINLLPNFLRSTEGSKALKEIIQEYNWLRKVYRAKNPDPRDVSVYKERVVALAKHLLKEFPWALWPNYFHRVVEHVQELIEKHGSVGALSAEGVEAGNKQVRLFRTLFSCTSSAQLSMEDIIQLSWLVSSKTLQKISRTSTRSYVCGKCGEEGHSTRTCLQKE